MNASYYFSIFSIGANICRPSCGHLICSTLSPLFLLVQTYVDPRAVISSAVPFLPFFYWSSIGRGAGKGPGEGLPGVYISFALCCRGTFKPPFFLASGSVSSFLSFGASSFQRDSSIFIPITHKGKPLFSLNFDIFIETFSHGKTLFSTVKIYLIFIKFDLIKIEKKKFVYLKE